jgi:hypothetical protein
VIHYFQLFPHHKPSNIIHYFISSDEMIISSLKPQNVHL